MLVSVVLEAKTLRNRLPLVFNCMDVPSLIPMPLPCTKSHSHATPMYLVSFPCHSHVPSLIPMPLPCT